MSDGSGHALIGQGCAVHPDGRQIVSQEGLASEGYGLCSCGTLSPWFTSDSQRKQWHREHMILTEFPVTVHPLVQNVWTE